jgi:Na+/H+ antiporter NhaD/arsenite permease-like protein
MLFLFGMFVTGQALEESGYLSHLSFQLFKRVKSVDRLLLMILFVTGFASAFLMNDTLAIIGTPVALHLAKKHGISPKLLLLALAFAVTIGSVMSPIGNPQNLLIAINGRMSNPFASFFRSLFAPTVLNLLIAFFTLKFFFREHFHDNALDHSQEPIKDKSLATLSKFSLALILLMVIAKVAAVFFVPGVEFRLTYIALASASPVLLFSPRRFQVLKRIDWQTLVFFAAMFVLMAAVWESGFFQDLIGRIKIDITSTPMVLVVSIALSQLISNVPLAALYLPMLTRAGAGLPEMVALAAGSTIAGNLLILGAASNVIIIQNAEKRSGETLTFLEFAKVGIPLTLINSLVYWLFLR